MDTAGNSIALFAIAAMFGVEAWKAEGRLPRLVLTASAVIFALAGMFLDPLTDALPKVGTFVSSVFSSPSAWFTLAVALFFVIRPYWTVKSNWSLSPDDKNDDQPLLDFTPLDQLRAELLTLSSKLETFEHHINDRFEVHIKEIALNAGNIAGLKSESKKKFISLDYAMSAIGHREAMLRWSTEIEEVAAGLDIGACGGSLKDYAAWSAWENRHSHWEGLLDMWLIFASPYWKDLRQAVTKAPEYIYDNSKWSFGDNDFKDSNAVRKYKTFRITHINWEDVKDKVHAAVRQVAFEGTLPVGAAHD